MEIGSRSRLRHSRNLLAAVFIMSFDTPATSMEVASEDNSELQKPGNAYRDIRRVLQGKTKRRYIFSLAETVLQSGEPLH